MTNDIYTREDAEFLCRSGALDVERIVGVETGGCPHSAIREDASVNLEAMAGLAERFTDPATDLRRERRRQPGSHFQPPSSPISPSTSSTSRPATKSPAKAAPALPAPTSCSSTRSTSPPHVGADLDVMDRDARKMRGERPFIFTNLLAEEGLDTVIDWVQHHIEAS